LTCEKGHEALNLLWKAISAEHRKNIKIISHFALCVESAKAYDIQNSGGEDEGNPLETINNLFKELESKIEAGDCMIIQSVIDNQKTAEYDKVLYQLNRLKDEK